MTKPVALSRRGLSWFVLTQIPTPTPGLLNELQDALGALLSILSSLFIAL